MAGQRSTPGKTPSRVCASTSPSPSPRPAGTPITASPDAPLTPSTGEPRGKTALRLFPEPTIRRPAKDFKKDSPSPPPPATRPYVAINGVASLDGKVTMYGKAGP